MRWLRNVALAVLAVGCAGGCARREAGERAASAQPALVKVSLQTDWFPQAEHGGFYQALAKGYFREAGMEVAILPGGPGAGIKPKIARGDADFGLNRSDDVIVAASQGLPLVMVGAVFQHDPQALLVHAADPVKSFKDLGGRTVVASIGMTWIPFLQKKYRLTLNLKPNSYGLAGFLADPEAIQQCLVTNEPFYAQEHGTKVRTLLIADSGYDCYHAIICRRELVQVRPDIVRAFLAASIRGWRDYLESDPAPAHRLILERNRQTSAALLDYSRGEMIIRRLVTGDPARDEAIGAISLARLAEQQATLLDLKVLETAVPISAVATKAFLPGTQR
ncbi:MAG: ABC transporter substrate-binding protein [Verrucomicrobia bacterium]|nr:ABC transporter substrate-binding protein [Verrucomicrobiota bacterium]